MTKQSPLLQEVLLRRFIHEMGDTCAARFAK